MFIKYHFHQYFDKPQNIPTFGARIKLDKNIKNQIS